MASFPFFQGAPVIGNALVERLTIYQMLDRKKAGTLGLDTLRRDVRRACHPDGDGDASSPDGLRVFTKIDLRV